MNMSRKEVVVSNVSKEHDNPIAELVQVACRFDSEIILGWRISSTSSLRSHGSTFRRLRCNMEGLT